MDKGLGTHARQEIVGLASLVPRGPRQEVTAAPCLLPVGFPAAMRRRPALSPAPKPAIALLLLPVPTWASAVAHADRALGLLIRLWRNGPLGSVQDLALLGLEGRETASTEALNPWRQALARSLPFAHFTSPDNIQLTNLNQ